jgi:hypothetical protein
MPREMAEKMVANKAKQKDQDDVLLDLEHNDLCCVNKKGNNPESREDNESSTNTKHRVSNSSSRPSTATASGSGLGKRTSQRGKSAISSMSQANVGQDSGIMNLLPSIQSGQQTQNVTIQSLVDKIDSLESELYNEDGEDDYVDYDDDCSGQNEQSVISSGKRKADDEKPLSRFLSMSKRFKIKEVCSDDVDQTLVENVTDLFHNGMDEEHYNELTKDDVNGRPDNCTGLTVVRTNQLVWDLIAPSTQQIDKKLQYIEKSVIMAAIIMTRTVNDMAKEESCGNSQWIDNCNDSLALLGHCNRQINLLRRDLIKPYLCWDYVHLCAHSLPYTNFLFGDDVSKSAKEIETCNK